MVRGSLRRMGFGDKNGAGNGAPAKRQSERRCARWKFYPGRVVPPTGRSLPYSSSRTHATTTAKAPFQGSGCRGARRQREFCGAGKTYSGEVHIGFCRAVCAAPLAPLFKADLMRFVCCSAMVPSTSIHTQATKAVPKIVEY